VQNNITLVQNFSPFMENALLAKNTLMTLKAYMASHATFNALTTIQNLIADDSKRAALKSLSVFANFIRKAVDQIEDVERKSELEMAMLQYYCTMEQWRFEEKLIIELVADNNQLPSMIPSFIIVPFAEFCIRTVLAVNQKAKLNFRSFNNSTHFGIIALSSVYFDDKNLAIKNNEQENRYQLMQERILLYKNIYNIEIQFHSRQIQLNFQKI